MISFDETYKYTYQSLRDQITTLLASADGDGLIRLITPENIETVRACASDLIGPESQAQPKSLDYTSTEADDLVSTIAVLKDVDDVLYYFTSTNAMLSQFYVYREESGTITSTYLQAIDEVAFEKNDDVCS